jgi:hypothetical protein
VYLEKPLSESRRLGPRRGGRGGETRRAQGFRWKTLMRGLREIYPNGISLILLNKKDPGRGSFCFLDYHLDLNASRVARR